MTFRAFYRVAAMLSSLGIAGLASADTISITTSADNTLYETAPDGDPSSNGIGEWMFTGETGNYGSRRAVMKFDIVGSLPAGSVITSVSLKLHMSRTTSGAANVSIQRLTNNWGEGQSNAGAEGGFGTLPDVGDATWYHNFYATSTWATPGGDFSPTVSAVRSVSGIGFYTWNSTASLVADVQSWLNNPAQNFGWIMVGRESSGRSTKRFDTRENASVNFRPALTIEYTIPEPATISMLLIAGATLLRRRSV